MQLLDVCEAYLSDGAGGVGEGLGEDVVGRGVDQVLGQADALAGTMQDKGQGG